jgi:hypothetical protein
LPRLAETSIQSPPKKRHRRNLSIDFEELSTQPNTSDFHSCNYQNGKHVKRDPS